MTINSDQLMGIAGPAAAALTRLRDHLAVRRDAADIYLAYAGNPLKLSGFLVSDRDDIDRVIAFCPMPPGVDPTSDGWAHETVRQLKIAIRVAGEPSAARSAGDVIWLGYAAAGERRVPEWVYALQCLPLTYPWAGELLSPRPFCPVLFERMAHQPQAAKWLSRRQTSPPAPVGGPSWPSAG